MRLTEEQYSAITEKRKTAQNRAESHEKHVELPTINPAKKTQQNATQCAESALAGRIVRHKYGAKQTETDGIKFSSKLEAAYYTHLKKLQQSGEVVFFLRQTPLHLEGNVKYTADFQVFRADGSVEFVDTKGKETKEFIRAKKQVEARYPLEIKVVKRGTF